MLPEWQARLHKEHRKYLAYLFIQEQDAGEIEFPLMIQGGSGNSSGSYKT